MLEVGVWEGKWVGGGGSDCGEEEGESGESSVGGWEEVSFCIDVSYGIYGYFMVMVSFSCLDYCVSALKEGCKHSCSIPPNQPFQENSQHCVRQSLTDGSGY